jgi:hypothetical protein
LTTIFAVTAGAFCLVNLVYVGFYLPESLATPGITYGSRLHEAFKGMAAPVSVFAPGPRLNKLHLSFAGLSVFMYCFTSVGILLFSSVLKKD